MKPFRDFDPLAAKQSLQTKVAINAMKRELMNTQQINLRHAHRLAHDEVSLKALPMYSNSRSSQAK